MNLNEARSVLHENGYELIDEGFFGDKYEQYKNAVMKKICKLGVDIEKYEMKIKDWIRDYFLDNIDIMDCALAIRDNCK